MTHATPESDIEAIERFVVENDDLLELEERVGRFNIFDALGIVRAEVRHSNFLGWLLDPSGSHGQGDLFIKAVLMDLFKHARQNEHAVPISPVELDGGDLDGFEVRREWNRIDLLLVDTSRKLVIAIENKVDSGEHSDQLNRYEQTLDREFAGWGRLLVFLTPSGEDASDDEWVAYSYRRIRDVLARVKRTSGGSLGSDVGAFIDHYLNLLETRLMDDEKIAQLCRRIYTNHRRAIELIVEHMPSQGVEEIGVVQDWLAKEPSRWLIKNVSKSMIFFVPTSWVGTLCDAQGGRHPTAACDLWVECAVWVARRCNLSARVVVGEGMEADRRLAVIKELNSPPFSFGMQRKTASGRWTRLASKTLLKWDEQSHPAREAVEAALAAYLDDLNSRLDAMPKFILAL